MSTGATPIDKGQLDAWLCAALRALAADPAEQLIIHPPTQVCPACELLSDYDNWGHVWRHREDVLAFPDAVQHLAALDQAIAQLTVADVECFSEAALKSATWSAVRQAARVALQHLGWERHAEPYLQISPGTWRPRPVEGA
ncbi:MAG TPA: hypothetical protein VKJ47_13135 [Candidatus Binatia bacterium]|nr:hypothetical protein [Candidatus Binatia bacterium]